MKSKLRKQPSQLIDVWFFKQIILSGGRPAVRAEVAAFEEHRKQYIDILRDLRKKHPTLSMEALEIMAEKEILNVGPKSRAFYRMWATRRLTGTGVTFHKVARGNFAVKERDSSEGEIQCKRCDNEDR